MKDRCFHILRTTNSCSWCYSLHLDFTFGYKTAASTSSCRYTTNSCSWCYSLHLDFTFGYKTAASTYSCRYSIQPTAGPGATSTLPLDTGQLLPQSTSFCGHMDNSCSCCLLPVLTFGCKTAASTYSCRYTTNSWSWYYILTLPLDTGQLLPHPSVGTWTTAVPAAYYLPLDTRQLLPHPPVDT